MPEAVPSGRSTAPGSIVKGLKRRGDDPANLLAEGIREALHHAAWHDFNVTRK